MREEKVTILELEGGEVNILNAEKESVKLTKTGLFLCKTGSVTLTIDGTEYQMHKGSIIVYFSYSTLHIKSHTSNLKGTLIGANLETIQPMLYNVSNFNALFIIKQAPYQEVSEAQYKALTQHIALLKDVAGKVRFEQENPAQGSNQPVIEIARKQAELLSYSLMLEVLQCYTDVTPTNRAFSRKDEVLQKFVTQLYRHYRTQHEVSFYAEQQFLTTRYFSTIIKECSGKSPTQWIATALLVEARNLLLHTNMTIKEISDALTFPNQSYFGKWFKNLTTLSPLDFRKGMPEKNREDKNFIDVVQRGIDHAEDNIPIVNSAK
jgi:AraC-like DNA-binding protein